MRKCIISAILVYAVFAFTTCATSGTSAGSKSAGPAFTGDGGKGKSIAILSPLASGLAENQNYLPELVQGEFVSNFSSYSAISVLDRVNLDNQYAELLSGYYSEKSESEVSLGHLIPTDYLMTGRITRTSTGYNLQIQIARNKDNFTEASYSGTFTFAELDNLSGIRRASLDLLEKIGVEPTARTRNDLMQAASANRVNAQTSLAQGIVAQRSGNTVETMARFYEAASYDPSVSEAVARANTMSASVRTGSFGENLRNDLAWRNEWIKILADAREFLKQPFVIARIYYNGKLKRGKIDYAKGTVNYHFDFWISGAPFPPSYLRMIADLNQGLNATGRNKDWKLAPLSNEIWSLHPHANNWVEVSTALVTSYGRVVAGTGITDSNLLLMDQIKNGTSLYSYNKFNKRSKKSKTFVVKADDITDQMTVRISALAYRSISEGYKNGSQTFRKEEWPAPQVIYEGK